MNGLLISIRRTPYQSLAVFLVLFFSLFLVSFLIFSVSFVVSYLRYIESRPQVTVYFQPKASENDISKIKQDLVNSGKTLEVKYVSKEKAFQIYKDQNKDNPLLLDMVSSDILPASLEIYAKKPEFLTEIADYLKKQSGVDEVQFKKDIADRLFTLTSIVRKVSFIFSIYLFIMSTIVITSITMFKITIKKDEIELLRLLGASKSYIKKPFIMENIFLAIMASVFSYGVFVGILFYIQPFLNSYLKGVTGGLELTFFIITSFSLTVWPFNVVFLLVTFMVMLLFGIFISLFGSFIATEKHLS